MEAALVGARELVGPIIAMTVTLATVYLPIGLQGGLTGSLFREFAFTLAGAVTISGIVALTLSPVMSARILKPGMEEHGLAGTHLPRFRPAEKHLRPPSRRHPGGASGGVHGLDRGVPRRRADVHHVRQGTGAGRGPGGHLRHSRRVRQFDARPEPHLLRGGEPDLPRRAGNRLHLPDHLSQLRVRRDGRQAVGRAEAEHLPDPSRRPAEAAEDPRDPDLPDDAAGPPRRRRFPGGIRPGVDGGNRRDPGVRQPAAAESHAERDVRLPAADRRQGRPAAVRVRHRPGQGRLPGPQPGRDRRRPGRTGRRRLREPLRHLGPKLQGHPPDPADRPSQSRPAQGRPRHRPERQTGPAEHLRHPAGFGRAPLAQPVPAAERGQDQRRRRPAAGRGVALHGGRSGEDPAQGVRHRLHRRVPPAAHRGEPVPSRVQPGRHPDLPGAGGAVQQLPRSVRHPGGFGAAGHVRRAHSSRS